MADSLRARQGVHNLSDAEVSVFRDAYGQMQAITDNRGFAYFGLHGVPTGFASIPRRKRRLICFCPGIGPIFIISSWRCAAAWRASRCHGGTGRCGRRAKPPSRKLRRQDGERQTQSAVQLPHRPGQTAGPPHHHPQTGIGRRSSDAKGRRRRFLDRRLEPVHARAQDQLHNAVHGWVGGDMGIVAVAASIRYSTRIIA